MAKRKKAAAEAAEKQLRAAVKKLQAQLKAAEKSADKWKSRAKDHKSVAAGIKAELGAARRRLEKTEAAVSTWKDRAQARVSPGSRKAPAAAAPSPPSARSSGPSAPAAKVTSIRGGAPDETWTVAALRAEARTRGVTGYSRKTKAELLADLRG